MRTGGWVRRRRAQDQKKSEQYHEVQHLRAHGFYRNMAKHLWQVKSARLWSWVSYLSFLFSWALLELQIWTEKWNPRIRGLGFWTGETRKYWIGEQETWRSAIGGKGFKGSFFANIWRRSRARFRLVILIFWTVGPDSRRFDSYSNAFMDGL